MARRPGASSNSPAGDARACATRARSLEPRPRLPGRRARAALERAGLRPRRRGSKRMVAHRDALERHARGGRQPTRKRPCGRPWPCIVRARALNKELKSAETRSGRGCRASKISRDCGIFKAQLSALDGAEAAIEGFGAPVGAARRVLCDWLCTREAATRWLAGR